MLKKTITYTDFDGNKRTEDHYFNLTQTELVEITLNMPDGMSESDVAGNKEQAALRIIDRLGGDGVFSFIKELILKSYGIKSSDGKRFEKSDKISKEFSETLAFDQMFMEMMQNDKAASDFITAVIPADLAATARQAQISAPSQN